MNWALLIIVTFAIALLLGELLGKRAGISGQKRKQEEAEAEHRHRLMGMESQSDKFRNEIKHLKEKVDQQLHFLVTIPEMVKNMNSMLPLAELVAASIRMAKQMIDTDQIEVYRFSPNGGMLRLMDAYGKRKGQKVEFKLGEGLIGKAAEMGLTVTPNMLKEGLAGTDSIEMAAPIIFHSKMLGVIGIGKVKAPSGNEKRFLSMIADLMAVALRNLASFDSVKEDSIRDALTGLFNRRHFMEAAAAALHKAANYNFPLSICIFDIDHFKSYNDTNGHLMGDELLKELGGLLKQKSRSSNLVSRYGGDEFMILLNETDREKSMLFAGKLIEAIAGYPFKRKEKQPLGTISISGGIATFPEDGEELEDLLKKADMALYASKKAGRARIMHFDENETKQEDLPGLSKSEFKKSTME